MVRGIESFREWFRGYEDRYAIIGGTACDLLKTRCIITFVALMAQGITDSALMYHLQNAKAHGVTKKEFAAIVAHVAFYAGACDIIGLNQNKAA